MRFWHLERWELIACIVGPILIYLIFKGHEYVVWHMWAGGGVTAP